MEKIGSEPISSAREAGRRAARAARRSSAGSEWINWHTFNWEGSLKRPELISLLEIYIYIFPCAEGGGSGGGDADGVDLVNRAA